MLSPCAPLPPSSKPTKNTVCIAHMLVGASSNSSSQPLKDNWILSHAPTRSQQLWRAILSAYLLQFLCTFLKVFLPRLLLYSWGWCGKWERLLQKPSTSFIHNYKSGVINTTATDAFLPITAIGSKDHELPHGFPEATQIPDIHMVSGDIMNHRPHHGHKPKISTRASLSLVTISITLFSSPISMTTFQQKLWLVRDKLEQLWQNVFDWCGQEGGSAERCISIEDPSAFMSSHPSALQASTVFFCRRLAISLPSLYDIFPDWLSKTRALNCMLSKQFPSYL